jgi:hypothetical protein
MPSNCLIWALALHRRRVRKGHEGYLLLRWSRWGPFPHALYGERRRNGSVRLVSYKPAAPRAKPVPPLLFEGRSQWGDLMDDETR